MFYLIKNISVSFSHTYGINIASFSYTKISFYLLCREKVFI